MSVDATHPDYDAKLSKWNRAEHLMNGQDAMIENATEFIDKVEGESDDEYSKRIKRGNFFNASRRTVEGFTGMVFAKPPIVLGRSGKETATTAVDAIELDADMQGVTLEGYAKHVVFDVLKNGRCGTLVDWNEAETRPYFAFYETLAILNWHMERINGRSRLVMVTLHEKDMASPFLEKVERHADTNPTSPVPDATPTERIRVLKLVHDGSEEHADENYVYQVEIWVPSDKKESEWELIDVLDPTRSGDPLHFIPFVFHAPKSLLPKPALPPLDDLFTTNVSHWRQDIDYREGLYYTGRPVAYALGFDAKTELAIGAKTAWVSEKAEAKVGYLEFTGSGLSHVRDALEDLKKEMAVLGARLLEEKQRQVEAAETQRLRQSGESSILADIAGTTSEGLSRCMKFALWWSGEGDHPDSMTDEDASVELNRDFDSTKMPPSEAVNLVEMWMSGGISKTTMLWNMKQGELLPPNREIEEEMELIEEEVPPALPLDDGGTTPKPKDKDAS